MIFFTSVSEKDSLFHKFTIKDPRHVWGITELSNTTFIEVQPGDYIFFYKKGSIIACGEVLKTTQNKMLSHELFGNYTHRLKGPLYWSNLIFFKKIFTLNIKYEYFQRICGYSSRYSVRRIIKMNQTGINQIIASFGSEKSFIKGINNGLIQI